MDSYRSGSRFAAARLPWPWVVKATTVAALVTLVGVLIEHRAAPASSADSALVAVTFGVVIPLLTLTLVARTFPHRVDAALLSLARHGADRRLALAGAVSRVALVSGAISAVLATLTRALGGSIANPGWGDLWTSAWVGAIAALGYSLWFALGSCFGERAQGRWLALILDWVLGVGVGVLAMPWPRGHLRNLLGGAPVAHLEQPHASVVLALLMVASGVCAWIKTPR